jgi:anti-anti-sigma factor
VLGISSHRHGTRAVIDIDGELDLRGVDALQDVAHKVLASPATGIEIDATDVRFIDSTGLRAVLAIRHDVIRAGLGFRVTAASDHFRRIATLAGLYDVLFPAK